MIPAFVQEWDARKESLRAELSTRHPENYLDLVTLLVRNVLTYADDDDGPDPERITEIDHGEYHGTLLYVVAAKGYQPSTFYIATVSYGSCSGCDSLESIRDYDTDKPTAEQANEYLTLALHVVQQFIEVRR